MSGEFGSSGSTTRLDAFARAQVLTRLREAAEMAESATADDVERLHALVADVGDRIGAWLVATARGGEPAASVDEAANDGARGAEAGGDPRAREQRPMSRCRAVLGSGGEPVREFLLLPFGQIEVDGPLAGRDFEFTTAHAASAKQWFDGIGRKLAIDYEHQSLSRFNTRDDGLRPAAGWIGGLNVRADGLWAVDVTWTPRATDLLRSGEYRYFSPVVYWTDEDYSDVAALGPVALTNDPAMRGVSPLAARRAGGNCGGDIPATAAGVRAAQCTDDSNGAIAGSAAEGELVVLQRALHAAQAEITALHEQLAEQCADEFVDAGKRAGKIVESTSADWRADFLADAALARERLTRAPVVLPPGRVQYSGVASRATTGSAADAMSGPRCGIVESADLAAYDRAVADRRVHFSGVRGV